MAGHNGRPEAQLAVLLDRLIGHVCLIVNIDDLFDISVRNPRVPYTLAKLAICYCTLASLWLLVSGLSSQFLTLFPNQLAFEISTDW